MKKIISGMLICASLAGAMGSFTSCKDTDDDQYAVLQREDFRLMQLIQQLQGDLEAAKQQLQQELNKAINDLRTEIANGYVTKTEFEALEQRVTTLEQQIANIEQCGCDLADLENKIKTWVGQQGYLTADDLNGYLKEANLDQTIATLIADRTSQTYQALVAAGLGQGGTSYDDSTIKAQLKAALESLGCTVNEDGSITYPEWAQTPQDIADALTAAHWVDLNKQALDKLLQDYGNLDPSTLLTKDDAAQTYLTQADFEAFKNSLKDDLAEFVKIYNEVAGPLDMKADFANLNELLADWIQWRSDIAGKVAANETAIKALQEKYNLVGERLDAMITSIVAEGTWNPVFGTFAAPVGVASNVLMTYCGDMGSVQFPYDGSMYEFDGEQILTTKDMQMLGVTPKQYSGVVLQGDENNYVGNAGTLYMTVNPGNADMTGKTFTLVNSQNQQTGMTLATPVKSDKVLTFGYNHGRATQDVSLYEAEATLLPADIEGCRITIEEGLKSAAKDFYNNRDKNSLVSLMKAVYDQLNGILPRMAVRAEWQYNTSKWNDVTSTWVDATETGIVRSGLDIAATTFKPLSYKSLEGKKFNRKLPILDEISIDWDKLIPEIEKIKIDPINLEDKEFNFTLSGVNFDNIDTKLEVTVTGKDSNGNEITLTGDVLLDDFVEKMKEDFNTAMSNSSANITKEFERIMKELQDEINGMLTNVEDQINQTMKDLMNQIKNNIEGETGKYFDKVNSLINKYNSIANRINALLENPRHYMQVTMLYGNSQGGISLLSTNETAPSKFKGTGAIMFYPTTYNLEIVSPAFKKFVGICNAVNVATGKSAQDGDAAAKAALDKANKGTLFNEVIDGRNLRVATGDLTPGFIYEVAYSALDYRGFTSTNKYYFQVNN